MNKQSSLEAKVKLLKLGQTTSSGQRDKGVDVMVVRLFIDRRTKLEDRKFRWTSLH
jgi:hypothetical protein